MTDANNYPSMDQNEFMKRMKAIATDLWGGIAPAEEEKTGPAAKKDPAPAEPAKPKPEIQNIWKTADETIDWTDALAHEWPTDGLTSIAMWKFYHRNAEAVLNGDLTAYAEVLRKANPLGELMEYAHGISMRAPDPDRLEAMFTGRDEHMEKDAKQYLSAMGVRIARDLLACLPVSEVHVTASWQGKTVMDAVYRRDQLLHRNFSFLDPVQLTEECGAVFT